MTELYEPVILSSMLSCKDRLVGICLVIFLSASTLLLPGCTPKIKGWHQEAYRSSDYRGDVFYSQQIAALPVIILERPADKSKATDGRVIAGPYTTQQSTRPGGLDENHWVAQDAYQVGLSEILVSKIRSRRPGIKLLTPNDALKRLNDAGLTDTYARLNRDLPKSGLDSAVLKTLGSVLNSRYLLITQAAVTESKSDVSLNIIWSFGRQSVMRSVKIYGQIWDAQAGQQIWEGSGVGYTRLVAYEGSPLTEDMASKAVESLLESMMP